MTMKLYGTLMEFANKLCKIHIQLYSMKNEIGFMKKMNMYVFGRVSQMYCIVKWEARLHISSETRFMRVLKGVESVESQFHQNFTRCVFFVLFKLSPRQVFRVINNCKH